jgi:hypothetical protein
LKTSCEIIKDLLPLYHDNVCSAESRALIEEHIKECPACAKFLSDLSEELKRPVNAADEAKPIIAIQKAWKKDKIKAFIKGTVISVAVFVILIGAYIALTAWYIIPVPTNLMEISEVSTLSDGAVGFNLSLKDEKELRAVNVERIDSDLYMTPKRAVISMAQPAGMGPVSRNLWADKNDMGDATAVYIGTPDDRILIWQEGMKLPPASGAIQGEYVEAIENIYVTNESAAAITMIQIDHENESTGASLADNSPVPIGEAFGFNLNSGNSVPFTVLALDKDGNILAQADFIKDVTYNIGEEIQLYIRDGADGNVYITDK